MEFNFLATLDNLLTALIYLLVSFLLFFIGKKVYQLVHRDIDMDHELLEKDNLAFSYANVGYYIGVIIAIFSVFAGTGVDHLLDNIINIIIYGLFSIGLLNLSVLISDKVILSKFSLKKEIIEDENVGTGVIEGAMNIANGLIIHGVLAENQDNYGAIILLWALAQVSLILVGKIYNLITPYDIHHHIEQKNVAVGVGFSGAIIAMGNLVRFGVQMDADNWFLVGENLVLETGIGLVLLPLARLLTDKILLSKRDLTDEIVNQEKPNIGAAVIEAFAYVGGSVLICLSFA